MVRKLTRYGNHLALMIDPGLLKQLKINADTPLDVTCDGEALVVCPIRAADDKGSKGCAKPGLKRRCS